MARFIFWTSGNSSLTDINQNTDKKQIIDLEHASLHMSCPIVPREAPLPSLRQLQRSTEDPFYPLTQLMHTGLSHFTGRGLPTIWSFICSDSVPGSRQPPSPLLFTETDSKLIREWARQLDNWLVTWNSKSGRLRKITTNQA